MLRLSSFALSRSTLACVPGLSHSGPSLRVMGFADIEDFRDPIEPCVLRRLLLPRLSTVGEGYWQHRLVELHRLQPVGSPVHFSCNECKNNDSLLLRAQDLPFYLCNSCRQHGDFLTFPDLACCLLWRPYCQIYSSCLLWGSRTYLLSTQPNVQRSYKYITGKVWYAGKYSDLRVISQSLPRNLVLSSTSTRL